MPRAKKPAPETTEPTVDEVDVAPDETADAVEPVDRGPGPGDAVTLVRRTKETRP